MNTSSAEQPERPLARRVDFAGNMLIVELSDQRTLSVPLEWFPRLLHARPEELQNWELIGEGDGIHWPELDEDLSVEGLLAGRRSGESARSFEKWLARRARAS